MMAQLFSVLGFVGTIIVAVGYLPQIIHLARERCSAGVSVGAWSLWLLSSVLIAGHAFVVSDWVFIALQIVNILAIAIVIVLARRYEGMFCWRHKGHSGA
jgi:uncharacterized protein with PQ loop repeat